MLSVGQLIYMDDTTQTILTAIVFGAFGAGFLLLLLLFVLVVVLLALCLRRKTNRKTSRDELPNPKEYASTSSNVDLASKE